jgi:NADPH:quinone reductase-like Zn-dependent oxidoreductase
MMKAIVVRQYGGPEVLRFEEFPDPSAGQGEVLVRVAAASVNPADIKQRAGEMRQFFPIDFPGVIGIDVSGTVAALGPGVSSFSVGDQVFAMSLHTYAELCAVKAADLVKLPADLDLIEAAALPLVTTTGNALIVQGTGIQAGQTVLIAGAAGSVGRSAVFAAKSRGATVIAGVSTRRLASAVTLGADQAIAIDDPNALKSLPPVDAVADTVGGKTAEALLACVKTGGVFASVLGDPQNAKDYPSVKVTTVYASPDAKALLFMANAVSEGKFGIPIGLRMPLKDADKAHAAAATGGAGKILLIV